MSMLNPQVHERLIADKVQLCRMAGIPTQALEISAVGVCNPAQVTWLRDFNKHRSSGWGMVLSGPHAEARCVSITAALMRNFVDARLVPLNTLLMQVEKDAAPNPTVLVIPNLFIRVVGRSLPAWRIQALYDLLLMRSTEGKPSVVVVDNMQALEADYGSIFANHLKSHYLNSGE